MALLLIARVTGREWHDIELLHPSFPDNHARAEDLYEIDPSKWYASQPVASPASTPSINSPASMPTRLPFELEEPNWGSPAMNLPDSERFPQSPVPVNPPRGYFNYEISSGGLHGPGFPAMIRGENGFQIRYQNNAWKFVQNPSDSYWREFSSNGFGTWNGALARRDLNANQCGNVGMQSPIDIRLSGVACVEHHQIRTRPGDFRVSGSKVEKRIEHNKLRLVWQRRPCADLLDPRCAEPDPPHADFPNGWGGFADMMHLDFKLPAEHRIYGEAFDAEMQLFQLHPGRARLPAVSVLIRATPGGHNEYLQQAIDAFQMEYDLHRAECGNHIRNNRQLVTDFHRSIYGDSATESMLQSADYESWAEFSTLLDDPEFLQKREEHNRKLSSGIFDPFHEDLIPTYWFFGYDGSLTEPPCSEIVSWFVMDTPMIISPEQLNQMKVILFTHVDPECKSTSTHFNGSVARPIQESAGRQVWRCTRNDFPPDHERSG